MFRSRLRTLLKISITAVLFLSLTIFCAFVYGFPDHSINVALFKLTYSLMPKKSFLELYSPLRRDVNNGTIPEEVDRFLCRQIEVTKDESELSAIINLYAIQAGGREGFCIYEVSDDAKQKVIARIVDEFDAGENLSGKMMLIEQLRLGKSLGKGQIRSQDAVIPENTDIKYWRKWKDEIVAPKAKTDFINWWNLDLDWTEKRKIDPLKNSAVKINGCCG